jgi:hypothetical protein
MTTPPVPDKKSLVKKQTHGDVESVNAGQTWMASRETRTFRGKSTQNADQD